MKPSVKTFLAEFLQDARYTARQLRRAPFFTLTVVATLTLAVGATATMAGILRATLLNPLPYPHPEQLVQIGDHNLRGFKTNGLISVARAEDLRELQNHGQQVFSDLSFLYFDDSTITLNGSNPKEVAGVAVSGEFFSTIGVMPLLGRTIRPEDNLPRAPQVVVLSHRLWQSAFGGDPQVIGRTMRLGAYFATVIGVMPQDFDLPSGTDLWHQGYVSAAGMGHYRGDGARFVIVYARLHDGETPATAKRAAELLASRLATAYPETDAAWSFQFTSLRDDLFGSYEHALLLLSAAVALVLIVAAINIAGLQLSRNAVRAQEFAIRGALGVTRGRLVRQLLTESTLLVGFGSIAGVAAGAALLRVLASQLPQALLSVEKPHVDGVVIAASCAMAVLVGIFTGLLPALQSTRSSLALRAGAAFFGDKQTRIFGKSYAVAQIALSLVLLTVSATVLQNLYRLLNTRLGFEPVQLHTCSVDLPWGADATRVHHLYQSVESSLAATPGISGVGAVTALPLSDFSARRAYDIAGQPPTPQHDAVVAEARAITPGYLSAMHIPLLAGRQLTQTDSQPNAPLVLLINQTMAQRYFPGRNPVGQRLIGAVGVNGRAPFEIVGVIGDVHGTGGAVNKPIQAEAYVPEQGYWPHMNFAIRSPLPQSTLEPTVRRLVAGLDASASVGHFTSLSETLDRSLAQPRLNAAVLASFGALSLLLVVIGVYGLISFDVAQRTRELGLRLALGATRNGVLALVLRGAARMLAIGLGIGAVACSFALRLMTTGVTEMHAPMFLLPFVAAVLLSLAVLGATALPASRAASVDPMQALKTE